jgi:hypothetical protein
MRKKEELAERLIVTLSPEYTSPERYAEEITIALCNYFSTNELEGFVEFLEGDR